MAVQGLWRIRYLEQIVRTWSKQPANDTAKRRRGPSGRALGDKRPGQRGGGEGDRTLYLLHAIHDHHAP
jgi:hypothetical protein